MDYDTASTDDVESVVPDEYGGMWFFREPLGCDNVGLTLLELEPGGKGKAHDHADDDQEEVYLVVDGTVTMELGDTDDTTDEVTLTEGEAIRVGPSTRRQLHNRGDERVRLAIAGAP